MSNKNNFNKNKMMNVRMKLRKLVWAPIACLFFAATLSCDDDFAELNTNPLALSTDKLASSDVLLGQAFAQATYNSNMGLHWRMQISQSLFSDLWSGYYATTYVGFDSDRFTQVGRWADLAWGSFYGIAAPQVKVVEDIATANGNNVAMGMAKVVKVNGYSRMTDYWGPVPYSQFGNEELSVPFDSQQDMYASFFSELDAASSALAGGGSAFGGSDLVYGGNGSKWRKLAESMRLRLAMRIRFVDPAILLP